MEPPRKVGAMARSWAIGLDFAGSVAGGAFLGWLLDRFAGTGPWGLVGGLALGLTTGMYRFIREGLAANRRT